jgi:predicted metalloprotease
MRWIGGRESANIEDRRGAGGVAMPAGIGGVGVIVLVLVGLFFGIDPSTLLALLGGDDTQQTDTRRTGDGTIASSRPPDAGRPDPMRQFVSVVLADTEDVWTQVFQTMGRTYDEPKLVLFSDRVNSACGLASSATGPFYCPEDQKVYLDLSFFQQLRNRFNAPGEFAQAYVIAHEIGHHVQNELGILPRVAAERARSDKLRSNALSVRVELQADCLAGVWANHADRARHIIEQGDVEAGLNAASAVGDDRMQRQVQGTMVPDAFTHGSSAQRVRWFKRGLETGSLGQCDTFSVQQP